MPWVVAAKNLMLGTPTVDLASLHTGHPGNDGLSNELAGGGYARQPVTFAAASSGERDATTTPAFSVAAGSTIATVGYWQNLSTDLFHCWAPLGAASNNPQAASAEAAADTIKSSAHGLTDGSRVFLFPLVDPLPSPLVETTLYHVVGSSSGAFQVSLTAGGTAVDIAADGDLIFQKCTPKIFSHAGTFTLDDADLGL